MSRLQVVPTTRFEFVWFVVLAMKGITTNHTKQNSFLSIQYAILIEDLKQ